MENELKLNAELIRKLILILGNVSLEEAANWLEVEENARSLRNEGHETPTDELPSIK